jgi:hypothetical protein
VANVPNFPGGREHSRNAKVKKDEMERISNDIESLMSAAEIEIENFDLTYYNEDDDSNNSIILDPKIYDLVLETVQKWSASKIGISDNVDFNYYLTIEETEIQYFYSYSSVKLELNIVEKFK